MECPKARPAGDGSASVLCGCLTVRDPNECRWPGGGRHIVDVVASEVDSCAFRLLGPSGCGAFPLRAALFCSRALTARRSGPRGRCLDVLGLRGRGADAVFGLHHPLNVCARILLCALASFCLLLQRLELSEARPCLATGITAVAALLRLRDAVSTLVCLFRAAFLWLGSRFCATRCSLASPACR